MSTGPTTEIEIQSNAALILGKKPFTSISDSDQFALSVQKMYAMLVPGELGSNNWKFAKKQVQLSQVAGFDPDFAEWSTAYDLPTDLLCVSRLFPNVRFQIFENRIYTSSAGELKLEYAYDAPVTSWSAAFKIFITYRIAADMALSVAENPQLAQILEGKTQRARATAMFIDGQNSPGVGIQSNPWLEVRGSRYNNSGWGRYR